MPDSQNRGDPHRAQPRRGCSGTAPAKDILGAGRSWMAPAPSSNTRLLCDFVPAEGLSAHQGAPVLTPTWQKQGRGI